MTTRDAETDRLMDAVLTLRTRAEAYGFFEDLCTIQELREMGQRLHVAELLDAGRGYQAISETTGASTATISRVNKCYMYGADGYRSVLERLRPRADGGPKA